jgi:heme/copper-type cytochrome/quinol oxidase subunit 1
MRYFRRLPPLLRVASILGLLFALASLALIAELGVSLVTSFPQSPADSNRVFGLVALNVGMLSGACSTAVNTYSMRFRRPDRGPFPLSSWQSQVRAIVLLAALPLCALALAVFAPLIPLPLDFLFLPVAAISLLAAVVLVVANIQAASLQQATG